MMRLSKDAIIVSGSEHFNNDLPISKESIPFLWTKPYIDMMLNVPQHKTKEARDSHTYNQNQWVNRWVREKCILESVFLFHGNKCWIRHIGMYPSFFCLHHLIVTRGVTSRSRQKCQWNIVVDIPCQSTKGTNQHFLRV